MLSYPPGIIETSTSVEDNFYAVGHELNITCVTGPSDLSVVWHKIVVTGSGENYVEISTGDPRVSFEPTGSRSTLRISNVTNDDGGGYRCSGAVPPFDTLNVTFRVIISPGLCFVFTSTYVILTLYWVFYRHSQCSGDNG